MYTYEYPRPSLTVDVVLFRKQQDGLDLLLIQRKNDPYRGGWALPGGFVDENEGLQDAACRELKEETTVEGMVLHQFRAYGDPGRDPRGHTVSIVFTGTTERAGLSVEAQDDAAAIGWFPVSALPELAFDHQSIVEEVLKEDLKKR